jgi:hypothetical protein
MFQHKSVLSILKGKIKFPGGKEFVTVFQLGISKGAAGWLTCRAVSDGTMADTVPCEGSIWCSGGGGTADVG